MLGQSFPPNATLPRHSMPACRKARAARAALQGAAAPRSRQYLRVLVGHTRAPSAAVGELVDHSFPVKWKTQLMDRRMSRDKALSWLAQVQSAQLLRAVSHTDARAGHLECMTAPCQHNWDHWAQTRPRNASLAPP